MNAAVKDPLASDVAVAGSSDRTNAVSDCDDILPMKMRQLICFHPGTQFLILI